MSVRLPPHRAGRVLGPGAARPTPATALPAVLRRDLVDHRILRIPFVIDLVFALVNLAAFMLVTRWLSTGPEGTVHFRHLAVGLAFLLALQSAVVQVMQRITHEQRTGTLEFQLAAGVRPWTLFGGVAVGACGLGQLRLVGYLALAWLLLGLEVGQASWVGVAVMLLLGAALGVGIAVILAAAALAIPGGGTVGRLAVAGIGLVSGVFVPLDRLPPVLAAVGGALPTTAALDGLRAAISGGSWWPATVPLGGWVFGTAAVAAVTSTAGVRLARRRAALIPA